MPELPEVETTTQGIKKYAVGKTIVDCWTDYNSAFHKNKENIKDPKYFKEFKKLVVDTKIIGAERRAKNILVHLSPSKEDGKKYTLLIHLKMTGHVLYGKYSFDKKNKKFPWTPDDKTSALADPFNRFIHFVLTLENGHHLALSDMRKFAKVTLIETSTLDTSLHTAHLGPEPLLTSFDLKKFKARLSVRTTNSKSAKSAKSAKMPIKSALMDQELIAGIGNIYSDEILWRAGVHPESGFSAIPEKQVALMFKAMKEVLKKGIDLGGDSMSDYRNLDGERGKFQEHHEAYQRKNEPCRKKGCGGKILRKVIKGRSGHFCDTHQKIFL
jgi:formamidopyrimidine-DNA glycosylase